MTTAAAALGGQAATAPDRTSREGRRMLDDLMGFPREMRREFVAELPVQDLAHLLAVAAAVGGTPYLLWQDDPNGFIEDVLGETLWAGQSEVDEALLAFDVVAVPAGFGVGKTHIGGRVVLWRGACWPVGASLTVTTATRLRQVNRQLWPHVKAVHARAGLPGIVDTAQWKMTDRHGAERVVAYGFSAPPYDESAAQGIHGSNLLVIVDEAGAIGHIIGRQFRGLRTGEAKQLLIGNPATDEENTWFEGVCSEPGVKVIPIAATRSPNVTGEPTGWCRACPEGVKPHRLATHLVDQSWIDDTIAAYGADDPYVISKVHARFPKGGARKAIPSTWIDDAAEVGNPDDCILSVGDLGFAELAPWAEWKVRPGDWVRLGVDVAADGGDEFAIALIIGDLPLIVHTSSGPANENNIVVSGEVLLWIERAQAIRRRLGTPSHAPLNVKVDAIGVGFGVCGTLEAWGSEGMHDATIVRVNVAEKTAPRKVPDPHLFRPVNKRAEMWLAGRYLLEPENGQQALRLGALDRMTRSQLGAPNRGTNTRGETFIEPKAQMKRRGVKSPDRGEAVLLGLYEGATPPPRRKTILAGA